MQYTTYVPCLCSYDQVLGHISTGPGKIGNTHVLVVQGYSLFYLGLSSPSDVPGWDCPVV